MDYDFEESLPSNSNLIAPIHNGGYSKGERKSYEYSQYTNDIDNVVEDRAASPPPPPPPAHLPSNDSGRRMSEPAPKPESATSRATGKGRPSFPFLKKGSRKEPSGLHRSPNSKTPASVHGHSPHPSSNEFDKSPNSPPHDIYDSGSNHRVDLRDDYDPNEESDEILLTGTGYWQADDMKNQPHPKSGPSFGSTVRTSHQKAVTDHLDSSTIHLGGEQWQRQRDAVQDELDEFELIERQLENNALTNTFGAVNKFLGSSNHVVNNRAGLHPPDTLASRSGAPTFSTDDWSDAYEHDSFATTKNLQRTGSQPNRASFANTCNSNGSEPNFDESDAYGAEDEQYFEDFSGGEDGEQSASRPEPGQSTTATRQSVSTYMERISPQRSHNERDTDTVAMMSDLKAVTRAARPSYSNYWDETPTPPPDNREEHQTPAIRNTESPSWGRSTQPVGNSLESDGASEQDDRRGTLSRTLEANKVARMSNSALRKISSRTAALHGQAPPSRVERPTMADDMNSAREGYSDADESSSKAVQYTRPTPVRSNLANTHSGSVATAAKPRSSSTGGRLRPGAAPGRDAAQANLTGKAQELEKELETYRNENANLKKLRRQQEASLAEVVHQKEDLMRWVAEEKSKTLRWCEEQTQAATKERNAAAKMARDSRQKALAGAVPIRKEKAEIEALQATIEKMKVDHESATKKWKLTEARLYSLIKEHTTHIESIEKQQLAVEQEKLMLLEFIGEHGLRLPKELRTSLQRTPLYRSSPDAPTKRAASGSSVAQDVLRGKSPGGTRNKYQRDQGYAEEVDVEVVESTTSNFHSTPRASSTTGRSATPTARTAPKLSSTYQSGEVSNRLSSGVKSGLSATARPGSAAAGSRVADMVGVNASASWARSSRSSHGSASRYDNVDDEAVSDVPFVGRSHSEDVLMQTLGTTAKNQTVKNGSPRGQPDLPFGSVAAKSPVNASTSMFKSNLPTAAALPMGTVNLSAPSSASGSTAGAGTRVEEILPDGKKLIKYKNGTQKEIDDAGNSLVKFLNGDTKTVNVVSGVVVYYYAQADTTHTTFKDGLEVYEFPNKQVEMHFPDGIKEIIFPDSTRKIINPDGLQESHFPDGVILREHADGRREVLSGTKSP